MADEATPLPAWAVGTGLETDMTGDYRPGSGASRFWMPKGTDRVIIFLTEGKNSLTVWEHQLKINGDYRNWFTCLEPLGIVCPLCKWADENNSGGRYKAQYFTVVDTHEFTDRSGKKRKNERKLFCAKKDTSEIIKRKYLTQLEADRGLRGAMYKVFRTNSDKSSNVGEDFEYIKHADLSTLPESTELDMLDILKPDPEKVKNVIARLRRGGGDDSSETRGEKKAEGTESKVEY